jgi:hypothetical protein
MKEFGGYDKMDNKEALQHFVDWLQNFLDELVSTKEYQNLFIEELNKPMNNAWETVKPRFEGLYGNIGDINDVKLQQHGLVDQELRFKFSTIQLWSRRFLKYLDSITLKRLLRAIKTLLGSLLSATPLGSAISEYVDAIWDAVED